MSKSREVSQFSNYIYVDGSNGNVGIATTLSPNIGIGTPNPTSKFHVVGNSNFVGIVTATSFVGDITGNVNSSGVSTFTTLKVGTAVTISGGIVTATSFVGDGSALTNTGSTLSAASGSQRVVLTSQTSGTMTASATDSGLTFSQSTGTLSASKFSGDGSALTGIAATADVRTNSLVVSGVSTLGTVNATSFAGDGSNLTNIQNAVGYNTKGYKFFSAPGTFVVGVDCPVGVTNVKITGCGGGGAGGSGGSYPPYAGGGGGGGGGGASHIQTFYRSVSNGQTYTMLIGGVPGGSTTVSLPGPTNVFTLAGGSAGGNGTNSTPFGIGGSAGTNSPTNPLATQLFGALTTSTSGSNGIYYSTPGGGASGNGGNGGNGALNTQYKGYGNGGGGLGGLGVSGSHGTPGTGTASGGFILVEW